MNLIKYLYIYSYDYRNEEKGAKGHGNGDDDAAVDAADDDKEEDDDAEVVVVVVVVVVDDDDNDVITAVEPTLLLEVFLIKHDERYFISTTVTFCLRSASHPSIAQ
ncbi:hypothetical protein DPMN_163816 [Dreissena polymorpha]|uniref:Uncharacterized protein n=1 Tax=Dreissena polymorpha TaxID=45954 RepID=A0A9D4EU26_DREPO|nr:hypothetical protein DPMN_163816 [Dreissena polymorpha]